MSEKSRPCALITGASAGIGLSFATQLARGGYDLVLVARREDRLRALADTLWGETGVAVEVLAADLGDADGTARVAERIATGESIDLLVNNAGYAARGPVATLDPAALEAMLRVNIFALARLSTAAMARMTAQGRGAIINVSSGTMFSRIPGNAGYGASKNFVSGFTRVMQVEADGTGVQVQLLVPGLVATDFHDIAGNDIGRFPPNLVMQADDLVAASLRALALGEPVCIPSLPDVADWDAYVAAERLVAGNVSRDRTADRYR